MSGPPLAGLVVDMYQDIRHRSSRMLTSIPLRCAPGSGGGEGMSAVSITFSLFTSLARRKEARKEYLQL